MCCPQHLNHQGMKIVLSQSEKLNQIASALLPRGENSNCLRIFAPQLRIFPQICIVLILLNYIINTIHLESEHLLCSIGLPVGFVYSGSYSQAFHFVLSFFSIFSSIICLYESSDSPQPFLCFSLLFSSALDICLQQHPAINMIRALCPPCHMSLLHSAPNIFHPVQTQSRCCSMKAVEKTPEFWPASPVCEDLVHYSREVLEHKRVTFLIINEAICTRQIISSNQQQQSTVLSFKSKPQHIQTNYF